MLTKDKVDKLLNIVMQEYPSLKDEYIIIKEGEEFSVAIGNIAQDHIVSYVAELPQNDRFKKSIVRFLKTNHNINDGDYMFFDYEETFAFIHELGHIYYHNSYDPIIESKCYSNFKSGQYQSIDSAFEAYRNIPMEADADQFALNVLRNRKVEIWALMSGITEDQAKEEILFWSM